MLSSRSPCRAGRALAPFLAAVWLVALAPMDHAYARPSDAEREKAALTILQDAKAQYDKGQFGEAAAAFKVAFGMTDNPAYLFNHARAAQRGKQLDVAEKAFEAYLKHARADDKGKRRAKVHLAEIREMKAVLARATVAEAAAKKEAARRAELEKKRKAAAAEAVARKKAEEAAGLGWKRTTALASWGVGAAGLGVGTWLALSAASERQDAEDAIASYPTHRDYVSAVDDAKRKAVIGYATLGAGAVIAGVGTWLWLDGAPETTSGKRSAAQARLHVAPQADLRGVVLLGRF